MKFRMSMAALVALALLAFGEPAFAVCSNSNGTTFSKTVTTSETAVLCAKSNRHYLFIQNVGNTNPVSCGFNNTGSLTVSNTWMLLPQQEREISVPSQVASFQGSMSNPAELDCIATGGSTTVVVEDF